MNLRLKFVVRLVFLTSSLLIPITLLQAQQLHVSHCLAGCPTGANSDNALVLRSIYALSFNHQTLVADWVTYRVTSGAIGVATTLSRAPLVDPFLPHTLREDDYLDSREVAGVERNYFVPLVSFAATPFWQEVNYLSTMVPRNPELNRGSWYGLEWAVRNLSNRAGELFVVTGPLYDPANPQPQLATVKSHTVPSGFFMVVATAAGAMSAFVFEQQLPFHVHHCERQTSLREVEQLSGLDLFPESPAWPAADLSQQLGCVQ